MRITALLILSVVIWSCSKDDPTDDIRSTPPPDSLTVQIDVPACGNTPCAPFADVWVLEYYSGDLLHKGVNAKNFGYSHRLKVKNGFMMRLFAPNGEATVKLVITDYTRPDSVRFIPVPFDRAGYDTAYQTFDYVHYLRQ